MKLTKEQIFSIARGVENVEFEGDFFRFYRYTKGQINALFQAKKKPASHKRIFTTASVRLAFSTDATFLKLTVLANSIHPQVWFDIWEQGMLSYHIPVETGKEVTVEVALLAGKKTVEIYFPWNCPTYLSGIELNDGASLTPVRRKNRLVAYGDSITQGFYAACPSQSYANILARGLDAEIVNKGFGGDCFFPGLVDGAAEDDPDFVTAAYGTNDWAMRTYPDFQRRCRGFMESLRTKYPNAKVFIITPLWRGDGNEEKEMGFPAEKMHDAIAEICKDFPEFHLICGQELIPRERDCYGDDHCLHPSDKGFAYYGENLLAKIKEVL